MKVHYASSVFARIVLAKRTADEEMKAISHIGLNATEWEELLSDQTLWLLRPPAGLRNLSVLGVRITKGEG